MALAVLHADQERNSDEVRCRPKHTVFGREMVAPSTNEEDSFPVPALGSADPSCVAVRTAARTADKLPAALLLLPVELLEQEKGAAAEVVGKSSDLGGEQRQ